VTEAFQGVQCGIHLNDGLIVGMNELGILFKNNEVNCGSPDRRPRDEEPARNS
jgi:hypothetical protein